MYPSIFPVRMFNLPPRRIIYPRSGESRRIYFPWKNRVSLDNNNSKFCLWKIECQHREKKAILTRFRAIILTIRNQAAGGEIIHYHGYSLLPVPNKFIARLEYRRGIRERPHKQNEPLPLSGRVYQGTRWFRQVEATLVILLKCSKPRFCDKLCTDTLCA